MPTTPDPRAARIEKAIHRGTKLQQLIACLEWASRCDLAHARTNRDDDYLTMIQARHEASLVWDSVMEACTDDYREELACEAFSQCDYDMAEGCYVDDNGEPILPGQRHTPRGYNDWLFDSARDGFWS